MTIHWILDYKLLLLLLYHNICVTSLQKGLDVAKIKNEIFVDLNRADHNKSVKKKLAF